MQTTRPISAAIASSIEDAATDGGTKIALGISNISYCASFIIMPLSYNHSGITVKDSSVPNSHIVALGGKYLASAIEHNILIQLQYIL